MLLHVYPFLDFFVLGDSAYPLMPCLMTPFRDNGHLTAAQRKFNKKMNSCRVSIEHTFGVLKQRFRQLYHCKLQGHERLCSFIKACCILHNLADVDDLQMLGNEENVGDEQPAATCLMEKETRAAVYIRNRICNNLV